MEHVCGWYAHGGWWGVSGGVSEVLQEGFSVSPELFGIVGICWELI